MLKYLQDSEKLLEKVIKIFLPLVFFLPLLIESSYYFPFVTPRNFAFRILVTILLAAYAILLFKNKNKYKPVINKVLLAYIGLGIALTLSSILAGDFLYSFWSTYERMEGLINMYYLLAFLIVILGVYYRRKAWLGLFHITVFVSFIVAFIALSQKLGINIFIESSGGSRVSSTLGNPTYVATYGLFHIFFAAYLLFKDRLRKLRWELWAFYLIDVLLIIFEAVSRSKSEPGALTIVFSNIYLATFLILPQVFLHINNYWFDKKQKLALYSKYAFFSLIILLNFIALFNTETRGALVGLFLAIIAITVFLLLSKHSARKLKLSAGLGLLSVVVISSGIFIFKDSGFIRANPTLNRVANISTSDITSESRLLTWRASIRGWQDRPILGWGEENFHVVFNKYFPNQIFKDTGSRVWFDRAHNMFFQQLVHGGIVGLALYLSIFILSFYYLWQHYRRSGDVKTISIFGGLIIAYTAQNFFVFDSFNTYILFILMLAAIIFVTSSKKSMSDSPNSKPWVGLGLFFLIVVIGYMLNIPQLKSNQEFVENYRNVTARVLDQSTGEISFYDPGAHEMFLESVDDTYLGKFEKRQVYSENVASLASNSQVPVYQRTQAIVAAEKELLKSISQQPNNVRHMAFLSNLYLSATPLDITYADKSLDLLYDKAIPLSPTRTQLYYSAGSAYMSKKEYDKALVEFKKAQKLSPTVFDTYINLSAAYLALDDSDNVQSTLNQMVENVAMIPRYYSQLGEAYLIYNKISAAIDLLENRALVQFPKEARLRAQLVVYYYEIGDTDNALANLEILDTIDTLLASQVKEGLGL